MFPFLFTLKDYHSERWSEEPPSDPDTQAENKDGPPKTVKSKPKPPPALKYLDKRGKLIEPMTKAKAEWVTRKFVELFTAKSDGKKPLHLSVEDILEMGIDFERMDADFVKKLRDIADGPAVGGTDQQRSGDFERPSSSSSAESAKRKTEMAARATANDGKRSRATPKEKTKTKSHPKEVLPPALKKIIPPFPAELFDESRRVRAPRKPWIRREEVRGVTNDEQDAWVAESCEDITFIEYRRERILRGKRVPIGKKDFELDLIAGRMAGKLLAYEAAVNKALPDSGTACDDTESALPYEEQFVLPPKPLIPIRVDPNEDPDDEDTTSEEDEPKDAKAGKALRLID